MRAVTFDTPADLFAAFFGPEDHDAHVRRYQAVKWLDEATAASKRGSAAVDEFVAELREREAERVAAVHGFDTAALRREIDRWSTGCFSREPFAPTRIRQLTRALDIAIAKQGARAEAAE